MNLPKILCIDDSRLVQSLIARELEDYELQLHFANDGSEGLDCCLREMPDLVMLDIKMPTIDGIEFLEKYGFKCPTGVRGRNSDNKLYKEKMGVDVFYSLHKGMKETFDWINKQVN